MALHQGYEKHPVAGRGSGNSRNGRSRKQVLTTEGAVEIGVPRDRAGSFEPRFKGAASTRQLYVALGVNLEGGKELLGPWLAQTESAKFWLNTLTELKNRGVQDILIACVDGLKGFGQAIEEVFPQPQVRHSLHFVDRKERKPAAVALCRIYTALAVKAGDRIPV